MRHIQHKLRLKVTQNKVSSCILRQISARVYCILPIKNRPKKKITHMIFYIKSNRILYIYIYIYKA